MKKKEGIIPSLHTFFKDLWYLKSCANCMKRLVAPAKCSPTIKSAMRAAFDPGNAQFLIQTSETGFRHYSRSQADPAELGYRQLWLYAMRHYPRLSKKPQKREPMAKPNHDVMDHMILYDMAALARKLGFKSPQIDQLMQQSPDRQIAQDALLRARRPDCYGYNAAEVESLIDKVTECFLRAIPLDHQPPVQCVSGRETKRVSRYGHPQAKSQLQDRQFLFLDQIHGAPIPTVQKATSFFVRCSVYFTFFGKLPIPGANNATADESPDPDIPMSSLFVPDDPSSQDGRGGEHGGFAETRSQRDGGLERQRQKDARRARRQQKRDKKLRKRQRRERQSRAENHSMSSSGITGECELSQERPEENITGTESVASVNMDEDATEQGDEAAEGAEQLSPSREVENTLRTLEGHGSCIHGEVQGPSRTVSRKSEALREGAKWKPYDLTPRRRPQTPRLSVTPPQETLEQEINTLLEPTQTVVQGQTTRPLTQINFLEAQRHPQPGTNEEQNPCSETEERGEDVNHPTRLSSSLNAPAPSLMRETPAQHPIVRANQDGPTQGHHGRLEEALGSSEAEDEPQPKNPSGTDWESRRHGMINTLVEPRGLSPDPVPIDDSRQETVIQSNPPLSSQAEAMLPEASTKLNAHMGTEGGEQEGSGGRRQVRHRQRQREGAGKTPSPATKLPDVRITFRARDAKGEWNHVVHQMVVDPSDPSPVARMAAKNARERQATFYDQNLRTVAPAQCFDAAIEDRTNTVFMTFGDDLVINEDTMDSVSRALQKDGDHDRPTKRRQ
jgi:hypothetical protein